MSQSSGNDTGSRARRRANFPLKRLWVRVRGPLARSSWAKAIIVEALYRSLRFIRATNRVVPGSSDVKDYADRFAPAIVAAWHGQHILAPFLMPRGVKAIAMVSRSADAELNALVLAKLGIDTARGSGGRVERHNAEKGGSSAFLALKKALDEGRSAFMIADIPHGVPRQSGVGIVKLAQHSGRVILPVAVATSRRKVLEKSWDKTTVNLPFGRLAVVVGDPLTVPADADDERIGEARRALDDALNAATARAYEMVDRPS